MKCVAMETAADAQNMAAAMAEEISSATKTNNERLVKEAMGGLSEVMDVLSIP